MWLILSFNDAVSAVDSDTTELQHRQMFMNDFEVRLWELVIACLKVYCEFI